MQAVVSQQLISTIDGIMRPAFEVMVVNSTIRSQIRDGKIHQIDNSILSGKVQGMITMDSSIEELVEEGVVSEENALIFALNPNVLRRKI